MPARKYPHVSIGDRFEKLLVVEEVFTRERDRRFRCLCDCGKFSTPTEYMLNSGGAKSCGCVAAEKSRLRWLNPTPEMIEKAKKAAKNRTHSMSKHGAYRSWTDMRSRCTVQSHKWYPSYGGRGITICERWFSFENFWSDLGATWFQGAQLGRIDNNGNYEPSNVRWETAAQQQSNKSNSVFIDTEAGRLTASQASRMYGLTTGCIAYRLKVGFPASKLFQPSQRKSYDAQTN